MPRFFAGVDELRPLLGQEVAVSPWISVEQARIQHFADAIEDPQWIHVDVERARKESPYGVPIAHGFLTLSLLSHLSALAFEIGGCRMKINYGLNRVRFPQAVPAGGRIRARFTLKGLTIVEDAVQLLWAVTVELEGAPKPALFAEWLIRVYPA
ncbi:MAG TPA: MaoC family dehydratase [Bryobacteraceae bacterium]|nr:MaoC family dehydratase [Bryobacteraceae bacterium]